VPFCKNYSERDGKFAKKNFDLEIPRKVREKDIMLSYHEDDSLDNIFVNLSFSILFKMFVFGKKSRLL
jgi:hypothetical protein